MGAKSESKRRLILETAKNIVIKNNFNALTLDAVAKEAGISKGGLLYHFSSKDKLIKGLAEYIFEDYVEVYQQFGENDTDPNGRWTRALIKSTEFDLKQHAELYVGILAASYLDPDISKDISVTYNNTLKKLEDDGIDPVTATIIRLALDGLYYAQTLHVAPLDKERVSEVIQQLLKMTKSEES